MTVLGEEGSGLCAYRAFVCYLRTRFSVSIFLFHLVSGVGCYFCLWLFLDVSVYLFVLIVHLFVSYAHVNLYHFSLPPGVGSWLRLLLMALPGLFCLPFYQ